MNENKQVEDIFADVDATPKQAPVQPQTQSSDVETAPVLVKKKFPWWIVIVVVVILILIVSSVLAYVKVRDLRLNAMPMGSTGELSADPLIPAEGLMINPDVEEVYQKIEEANAKDFDFDGLTNEEERTYGTNPRKADSDNDGLFDRDEIMFYKTDPNDIDSDNDGYPDGQEVQSGYNPNGEGKLLNFQEAKDNLN